MKRTRATTLAALGAAAGIVAWLVERMLVSQGLAASVPPLTLGLTVAVLAVVLIVMAWPVRQASRGVRRIDHAYALGVVSFAKASSLTGAALVGASLGALAFFASRAVVAGEAIAAFAVLGGAGALQLIAGLVAEHWCVLPPDEGEPPASAEPNPV